jgi:hypothetical protein
MNPGSRWEFLRMKVFLTLYVLVVASVSRSASGADPAPSNVSNAEYPRIGSDLSVTLQLKAAAAKEVKLEGGAGLVKEPLPLTQNNDGVWTITTPPAVPGFHYYWFNVDGVRVNDPGSYSYFGYGRETSGIEIPEAGVDFYSPRKVPHGELRAHWYHSDITGKWRRAFVYTPPDYDRNTRSRYPFSTCSTAPARTSAAGSTRAAPISSSIT